MRISGVSCDSPAGLAQKRDAHPTEGLQDRRDTSNPIPKPPRPGTVSRRDVPCLSGSTTTRKHDSNERLFVVTLAGFAASPKRYRTFTPML
jgi:hypothetical protein